MRVFPKATVSPPSLAWMCRERIASIPGLVVSTIGLGKTCISAIEITFDPKSGFMHGNSDGNSKLMAIHGHGACDARQILRALFGRPMILRYFTCDCFTDHNVIMLTLAANLNIY